MKQATLLEQVEVFGWRAFRLLLPAGRQYGVLIVRDTPREEVGTITLFISGRIEGVNASTGERLEDRVPGLLTSTLGPLKAGRRMLTALVDTEWWCIDRIQNGGALPGAELIHGEVGKTVYGRLFICSGPKSGKAFKQYTPSEPCYILRLDRNRP